LKRFLTLLEYKNALSIGFVSQSGPGSNRFQGADVLEFLAWLVGELLFNASLNLSFFLWYEPRQQTKAGQWIGNVLGSLAVGAALGLLSVWLWGQPLLAWPTWRWVNLILSPWLVTALVVLWCRRRPHASADGVLRSGVMAFCLTFGLALTRHFSMT
jgi:hypothetical protein